MKKVLVTGASGYIGTMLLEYFLNNNFNCIAVTRNKNKLKEFVRQKATVIECNITKDDLTKYIDVKVDYIIHCAAPTNSQYMISYPVEVADAIFNGTKNILDFSYKNKTEKIIYLSSMEAYGQIDFQENERISEDRLGYFDIVNIRNCYPLSKIMSENLCISYWREYKVPIIIARLSQTFGRGVSKEEKRVFAQFGKAVIDNEDIILHTLGKSMGNYCDIDDTIDAIVFLLNYGKLGEIYNIVNEQNAMTIKEMAEMVAREIADNKIEVIIKELEIENKKYAADTGLRLSAQKMKDLGWEAKTSLKEMYIKMIADMKE